MPSVPLAAAWSGTRSMSSAIWRRGTTGARLNPLRHVPTLVTDVGGVLIQSFVILDWLDEIARPERALVAPRGDARRGALKLCALATGMAENAVSLMYERLLHKETSDVWHAASQIS